MATTFKRDLSRTMRWLRANGIQHEPFEIIEGSLRCVNGAIEYDTLQRWADGGIRRIPHRILQAITYQQANPEGVRDA